MELRGVLLDRFTLDDVLGSAGMLSARDPDGLPGGHGRPAVQERLDLALQQTADGS
jgi:hypothetical protein